MLKKVLAGLLVLILACLAYINSRPATYHIERSITIAAPADAVYGHIADFHQWHAWSPWENLDPTMQKTYSGAASGTGAVYSWEGTGKVGQGRMTVTDAQPGSKVDIQLEFIKPFASTNRTLFTLAPDGAGTKVTWSMDGKNTFVGKAFSMMMDMDKTVGGDFARGLATLKTVAESVPAGGAPADSVAGSTAKPS